MNLEQRLTEFYDVISGDALIGASHISLYTALLLSAPSASKSDPTLIYRHRVSSLAKISRRTFNKCMRDLVERGYIYYQPSTNSQKGSIFYLNKL